MGKRSVGLQKGLSAILEGARVPEEAREHGPTAGVTTKPSDRVRLDPIALLEDVARKRMRKASVWSRLKRHFSTGRDKENTQ